MKKLLYGLCLTAITQQLVAQEKANKAVSNPFSVTIHGGLSFGGPSETELKNLMHAAGLAGTEYQWLFKTQYPKVNKGGIAQLSLSYRIKKNWAMSGRGSAWGDVVEGYNEAQDKRVDFSYEGFSISLFCSRVSANNVFRIGVGPSLSAISIGLSGSPTKKALRVGYILDTGVRFPARSPLFVDLALQYQHAGVVTYGPCRLSFSGPKSTFIFPKADLPLNYLNLTLGFGIRL